jgi:DNA processing protein
MSHAVSDDLRHLLALQLTPGLGPRLTAALLERFGTAERIRQATADQLADVPMIGTILARKFADSLRSVDVDAEVGRIESAGVRLLALGTPDYPPMLASIEDAPSLLYVRGTLTLADADAVALVGSRHCTDYGRRLATRLATGLARAGVTVVSGLARGIDGIAHRATLQAGGRTLAVMAGGLSRIYPPEHADLAREVEASGALLTESSMQQEPLAGLFPARNRIISGLSRAVVIVEAAERSGALITATHAGEQGRSVMAVPGSVDNPASGGCNALIRDGAILVRDAADILEELRGVSAHSVAQKAMPSAESPPVAPSGPPPGLDADQLRIWTLLEGGAKTFDEMVQQLGIAVPQLSGTLMMLEMKKVVRRLPGNRYERC